MAENNNAHYSENTAVNLTDAATDDQTPENAHYSENEALHLTSTAKPDKNDDQHRNSGDNSDDTVTNCTDSLIADHTAHCSNIALNCGASISHKPTDAEPANDIDNHYSDDDADNNENIEASDGQNQTPCTTEQQTYTSQYVANISSAQNKDKNIVQLKTQLSSDYDKTIHDISSDPPVVKFHWSFKQRLKLENDVLYFADSKQLEKIRIIVPRSKVKDLLKLTHDDQTAGHRSAGKMLPLLKQHYHWFKMKSDIDLYVKQCQSCGTHKKPRANRPRAPLFQTKC